LRFAQVAALGRKVSDEFTVPLCRGHHRELHHCGDEAVWWDKTGIDPTTAARSLWLKSHPLPNPVDETGSKLTSEANFTVSSPRPRTGRSRPTAAMRLRARGRERKPESKYRAAMRFAMASQPRRSLARLRMPTITGHSRQPLPLIMMLSPLSSASLCCD
jgi:hypothetical protein